jgi:putative ABC transport system permease protein
MDAERVEGARVTPNLFPLLGVRPILGRGFQAEEDREGDDRVILLSHALWRRRYAGDSTIVGRTIPVNGLQFTVVGVMPEHFAFPDQGQVWVPLAGDPQENRGNRYFAGAIGRLAPGVTLGRAQRDMAAVASALEREFPEENALWTTDVTPLRDDLVGDLERPLLVFSGAVFFVLLIACSNVANLLLARSASRQREIAVRTALGAGRGRLVRQLLTESVLIAALGGALGVGASAYGVRLLRHSFPAEVPYYLPIGLNLPTLAFAALVTMATGVLFGILPAMRAAGEDASSWLRDGTRGTGGAARSRVRNALIVAEVALSLVLMTGAGLLIKSYRSLESTDLGFQETGVLSVRVYLPVEKYREGARRVAFFTQLLDRLRALPGVAAVGSAEGIPLSGWDVQGSVMGEGWPPPRPGEDFESLFQYVSPDYLTAIGVSIVRGRGLTYADHDSARVAVINESFAKRAFPNENPLGKRIRPGGPPVGPVHWTTIVGVARDFRHYRLPQKMGPALYYPFFASPPVAQQVVIRLRDPGDDPLKLAPTVRRLVSELDADVPISDVKTFEQAVSRSLWRQRLQGQVLGVFASLALLLAAVGIYGVISYTVAQRTREFGVRVALGAEQRDVMGLVLRQTARLAGAGVLIGLVVALALTRFLTTLLYEVKPTDTGTLALVVTVLVSITLLASWMPARRAMRVDPLVAMRPE